MAVVQGRDEGMLERVVDILGVRRGQAIFWKLSVSVMGVPHAFRHFL